MEILTREKSCEWCKNHSLVMDEESRTPLFPGQGTIITCLKPDSVKKMEILNRVIVDWMGTFEHLFCWITDWPLYREEQMDFFLRWRKGYGKSGELIDFPGHLFKQDERDISILSFLLMIYNWDFYMIPSHCQAMLFVSHDDYLNLYHADEKKAGEIKDAFVELGLIEMK